jgi:serine/threonine protein kinase
MWLVCVIVDLLLAHQRLNDIANFLNNKLLDRIGPYNWRVPEVFLQGDWGRATDIWSLGCLVSHCFRGLRRSP